MSGITTIECIRERCRIDEETGCWRWSGAMSNRGGNTANVPACHLPAIGRVTTVMRAIWHINGIPIPPKQIVWRDKCWQDDCCNPEHMRLGTRQQYGKALKASGRWKGTPARVLANQKSSRAASIFFDDALRAEVLSSAESGRAIGRRLGISDKTVSRLRSGRSFQPVANSSVFTWRG